MIDSEFSLLKGSTSHLLIGRPSKLLKLIGGEIIGLQNGVINIKYKLAN